MVLMVSMWRRVVLVPALEPSSDSALRSAASVATTASRDQSACICSINVLGSSASGSPPGPDDGCAHASVEPKSVVWVKPRLGDEAGVAGGERALCS
jgi:hypothetical protein